MFNDSCIIFSKNNPEIIIVLSFYKASKLDVFSNAPFVSKKINKTRKFFCQLFGY